MYLLTMKSSFHDSKISSQIVIYITLIIALSNWDNVRTNSIDSTTTRRPIAIIDYPFFTFNATNGHNSTIIFLHDYAEHGAYWCDLFEYLRKNFMKIQCPQAKWQPITWKKGQTLARFFDFGGDQRPRVDNVTEEMANITNYLHGVIEDEIKCGIPPERIILSGIQQGGFLALHVGLSFQKKLGAIVAFDPWHELPIKYNKTIHGVNKNVPIYIAHITGNHFTTNESQKAVVKQMRDHFSDNVIFRSYNDEWETFNKKEFQDAGLFIETIFGSRPDVFMNDTVTITHHNITYHK